MAKKSTKRSTTQSPRLLLGLILFVTLGAIGWWLWQNSSDLKEQFYQYIENKEISTLESRYTPDQMMEAHRIELIGNSQRLYQEPVYRYYPYLLLEVKYTEEKKSREGLLLWSLHDGEIVLNTETWETTHGFKDCLDCEANRQDFKVIQALAKHQGSILIEDLQKALHLEKETFDLWIGEAKRKHLIVQKGPLIQLHFENPKLLVSPQTHLKQHLVSKPIDNGQRVSKTYTHQQLIKIAKAAFGEDFKIRTEKEVFLPVYQLTVLNPDGSLYKSDWNAINGSKMIP
jgi:hypothetical protein